MPMPVSIRSFSPMWEELAQIQPCGLQEASVASVELLRSCMVPHVDRLYMG